MGNFVGIVVIGALLGVVMYGGLSWYRRKRRREASDPNCPICRSQNLAGIEGEIGTGLAVLGETYRCRDCGLERESLAEGPLEVVEALEDLQDVEVKLVEIGNAWMSARLEDDSSHMSRDGSDRVERRITEAWETLQRVREEHREAFEVPVPVGQNRTANELLTERLQAEDDSGLTLETFFDAEAIKRQWTQSQSIEVTLETIREALQAEAKRRIASTEWPGRAHSQG